MRDDLVFRRALHRSEAGKPCVVADVARGAGFSGGLPGRTGEARDQRQRTLGPVRRSLGGKLEHGTVEADIADRELRGVYADRKAAGAGVDVIARQRPLMRFVELAFGGEREGMRWQHGAVGDQLADLAVDLTVVHDVLSEFRAGDG